ncbi:hypothetical protein BGW38_010799 [Lunasporangiospora selenospora]|uniref:F-box domain-containing protein n=1 Tax=Lunasporangiospora selenospora TaxID=979761 RepID=A0A9P6KFA8_9FUNG|nr:hypothetical protein BGW38_010799 [Lunasporangiospora selenospora]
MEKALEINEIRTFIGYFLNVRDLKSCALVNKAWSQSMTPLIWSILHWWDDSEEIISSQAMAKYGHHVRSIFFHHFSKDPSIFSPCTQVRHIYQANSCTDEPFDDLALYLVRNNRTSLKTFYDQGSRRRRLSKEALAAIFECPNLEQLKLGEVEFTAELYSAFVQACTHLRYLFLTGECTVANGGSMLQEQSFPFLEDLSMIGCSAALAQNILVHSPNLKGFLYVEQMAPRTQIKAETILSLRHLDRLLLNFSAEASQNLGAQIISSLPSMKWVHISSFNHPYSCDPLFEPALRRHYTTLQAIVVNDDWTSKQILLVLTSCPTLRAYEGGVLLADEIQQGAPWVCSRLQCLRVRITRVTHPMEGDCRDAVYHQLARLDQLLLLDLSDLRYLQSSVASEPRLSLCLGQGLEILEPLKNLQKIAFEGLRLNLRKEEVEWMIQKWPSLQYMEGDMCEDLKEHIRLMEYCIDLGITSGSLLKESPMQYVDAV